MGAVCSSARRCSGGEGVLCSARPYVHRECGTKGKQNALIWYFIPKGMDMTNMSEEEVERVEDWVNTLPLKILGYEALQEYFDAALKNLWP